MSDNVRSAISKFGMVANVGIAVGIASPSVSVQKLFQLPVSTSDFVTDNQPHFDFLRSDNVVSDKSESGFRA